jgi:hypothetical protein
MDFLLKFHKRSKKSSLMAGNFMTSYEQSTYMLDKFCHIGMVFLSWVCPASLAGCFLAFTSVVVVVVESDYL